MVLNLYLEHRKSASNEDVLIEVTLESFICLFLLDYINQSDCVVVNLVAIGNQANHKKDATLRINLAALRHVTLASDEYQQRIASNCQFPVLVNDRNVVIAGLCGVCRNLVKNAGESFTELLGFKAACLMAPSEASIWTKFCEIDIVQCTKNLMQLNVAETDAVDGHAMDLPEELARFESHMSKPIRMHNVYKLARQRQKEQLKQDKLNEEMSRLAVAEDRAVIDVEASGRKPRRLPKTKKIASGTPIETLNIEHKFVEGAQISIADLILYPNFWIIRNILTGLAEDFDTLPKLLPLTFKWLTAIEPENNDRLLKCVAKFELGSNFSIPIDKGLFTFRLDSIQNSSLYKSDPKRYKPSVRIFTKQKDIEAALNKIKRLNLSVTSEAADTAAANKALNEVDFGWDGMPFQVLPDAADLPVKRLARKKHQLESLAKQIIRIARDGDRIVDFCSGTGHLGIVLAYKLPNCQIVLLENKEESLMRAKQRVDQLGLSNVHFFQCNLDYFRGQFDVGTSLHACGVATDIVLMHCTARRAKFVCCPCCYGGCHSMPHIAYPRSQLLRANAISSQDFMHLAHGADQSHVSDGRNNVVKCAQGQFCMDVVDTDRKLCAEEMGYRVTLCRLYPEDCTPKNRLLVGIVWRHMQRNIHVCTPYLSASTWKTRAENIFAKIDLNWE